MCPLQGVQRGNEQLSLVFHGSRDALAHGLHRRQERGCRDEGNHGRYDPDDGDAGSGGEGKVSRSVGNRVFVSCRVTGTAMFRLASCTNVKK